MSTDDQFLLISAFRTVSTTFSGTHLGMDRGLPAAHAGFVFLVPQKAAVSSKLCRSTSVMFGSVWRLCSCGQWHANRKPTRVQQCKLNTASTLSFPTTLWLACSRPTCKTSRLSLCATSFVGAQIPPVRPSRCVAAHREHRWDCVEEATENTKKKKNGATARGCVSQPVHRAASYRGPAQGRHKSMEDLRIHITIQATTELNKSSCRPENPGNDHTVRGFRLHFQRANQVVTFTPRRVTGLVHLWRKQLFNQSPEVKRNIP